MELIVLTESIQVHHVFIIFIPASAIVVRVLLKTSTRLVEEYTFTLELVLEPQGLAER